MKGGCAISEVGLQGNCIKIYYIKPWVESDKERNASLCR